MSQLTLLTFAPPIPQTAKSHWKNQMSVSRAAPKLPGFFEKSPVWFHTQTRSGNVPVSQFSLLTFAQPTPKTAKSHWKNQMSVSRAAPKLPGFFEKSPVWFHTQTRSGNVPVSPFSLLTFVLPIQQTAKKPLEKPNEREPGSPPNCPVFLKTQPISAVFNLHLRPHGSRSISHLTKL